MQVGDQCALKQSNWCIREIWKASALVYAGATALALRLPPATCQIRRMTYTGFREASTVAPKLASKKLRGAYPCLLKFAVKT
jgi:hypothetical protein